MKSVIQIIPGMEVIARNLRWEIIHGEEMGEQTRFRLRGIENATLGYEIDLLYLLRNKDGSA